MKKFQFSKIIFIISSLLFIFIILAALDCTINGLSTEIFMYAIPTSGAILAADIGFYHNKSKLENVWKMCISCIVVKTKSEVHLKNEIDEDTYALICSIIDENFQPLITNLESKIETTHADALSNDLNENYEQNS